MSEEILARFVKRVNRAPYMSSTETPMEEKLIPALAYCRAFMESRRAAEKQRIEKESAHDYSLPRR